MTGPANIHTIHLPVFMFPLVARYDLFSCVYYIHAQYVLSSSIGNFVFCGLNCDYQNY